jgi:hypothetical protein
MHEHETAAKVPAIYVRERRHQPFSSIAGKGVKVCFARARGGDLSYSSSGGCEAFKEGP